MKKKKRKALQRFPTYLLRTLEENKEQQKQVGGHLPPHLPWTDKDEKLSITLHQDQCSAYSRSAHVYCSEFSVKFPVAYIHPGRNIMKIDVNLVCISFGSEYPALCEPVYVFAHYTV